MKASDELSAKLQRQRLRSEGTGGGGDDKRAVSAPTARGSLVVTKASAGWHAFAQRPPRSTSATHSGPSQSSNRSEMRDLDELNTNKVGSTPTRSKRAGSDLEFSPRTSLRALTSGRVGAPARSGTKQGSASSSNQSCELKKRGSGDTKELAAKLAVAEARNEELQRQLDSTKHHRDEDVNSLEARLKAAEKKIADQEKELEDHKRNLVSLSQANAELTTESARLEEQLDLAQKASAVAAIKPSGGSSESALRAVMAKPGASVDELRSAIKAVEALVSEAQRELERGEYRQKRAAYEKLHELLGKAEEEQLLAALEEARRVGLNKEDIEKAEERLQELGSMTDDARHAKEIEKLKAALKPKLFLLVKKNDAGELEEELSNLAPDIAWEDWRDHNGRTLIKYARELRFPLVEEVLQSLLDLRKPSTITTDAPKVISPYPVEDTRKKASSGDSCSRVDHWTPSSKPGVTTPETRTPSSGQASPNVPSTPPITSPKRSVPEKQAPTAMYSVRSPTSPTSPSGYSGPYAEQKKAAFRAVSLADESGLRAALENIPPEEWSKWRNPGGQELLEMSKERDESRGTSMHGLLLQIQGVIVERKYESLEEGQAVWVFFHGEVVPRQATVREDTAADADKVLVEYWDGNDPATYVDRCVVNRLGAN